MGFISKMDRVSKSFMNVYRHKYIDTWIYRSNEHETFIAREKYLSYFQQIKNFLRT
jgi:hypothetical protein